jgi:heme/copper-type cytochrome/quinol oxidase subunit 3
MPRSVIAMPTEKPTHQPHGANHPIDSDDAWAQMDKPTGRKRLSFWWLFLGAAAMFFLIVIATFIVQTWTPTE